MTTKEKLLADMKQAMKESDPYGSVRHPQCGNQRKKQRRAY